MPRIRRRFCAGMAVLFLSTCGLAQAGVLDPAEIDASHLLPPPPVAGSPAAKAEIAELHAIAASRSPELLEKAIRDDGDEKPDLFNAALGFDIAALPVTDKLLRQV
jgi:hypothetical protein